MLNCKFKVGDHVRTTFHYSVKYDYFEGKVISIDDINLIEIVNNNGDRKFIFEHDLELVCIAKPRCKFKLGDKVKTIPIYYGNRRGVVKNIIYDDKYDLWIVDVCVNNFISRFIENDLALEHNCDKNKQILDLCEEIKNLKEDLKCEWKYNNAIKEELRIQNSCYRKTISSLENKVKELNVKINHILYYLILLTILLMITWM